MPSRTLATLSIVAAGILAPAATADAAKKASSKYPTVKKISPMTAEIGETITITGTNFRKGKKKNTVVFRRKGKRAIFAKADGLSSKRLNVKVPEKLRSSLGKKSGKAVATRFQIRVLARRFGKRYTALKKSPRILPTVTRLDLPKTAAKPAPVAVPAPAPAPVQVSRFVPPPPPAPNCDGDGQVDSVDTDDDNDLLPDALEATLKTNRCLADTDGDGMQDGWEYQSAYDLNQRSCPKPPAGPDSFDYPKPCAAAMPFPGKKHYPNALTEDAGTDYDGDWVPAWAEHQAWLDKGKKDSSYRALTGSRGMWYSAGKKASLDTAADDPDDNDCVGAAVPDAGLPFGGEYDRPEFEIGEGTGSYPSLDTGGTVERAYEYLTLRREDGDECLDDSERDEDGDFLSNFEELNGPMSSPSWWVGATQEPAFREAYAGTDWLDPDSDGDGTVDALDDQDFDDFLNIEELDRGFPSWTKDGAAPSGTLTGLWVQPFNPCLPNPDSRTCPTKRPLGNPDAWAPYSADTSSARKPRWPLYRTPLYGWLGGLTPLMYPVTYTVDDGPDPDDEPDVVNAPAEIWTPNALDMPAGYGSTTGNPPLHPLPRPDLAYTP